MTDKYLGKEEKRKKDRKSFLTLDFSFIFSGTNGFRTRDKTTDISTKPKERRKYVDMKHNANQTKIDSKIHRWWKAVQGR